MKSLHVKFTETWDGRPLAVVNGFPGNGVEMTVDQLRAMASTLSRIADGLVDHRQGKNISAYNEYFIVNAGGNQ